LSFAVAPEFRERRFVARTRLRISQDLLNEAMRALREAGAAVSRAIVDADNLEARLFYLGNGWQPGAGRVPGWRKHTVEFLWHAGSERAAPSPRDQSA
jgi:ribosomal protein S18 acetylase RimI-like enzyme